MSENTERWEELVRNVNVFGRLLRQYEEAKIVLADGTTEVELSAGQITALKQAAAAARTAGKAAWDAITA